MTDDQRLRLKSAHDIIAKVRKEIGLEPEWDEPQYSKARDAEYEDLTMILSYIEELC